MTRREWLEVTLALTGASTGRRTQAGTPPPADITALPLPDLLARLRRRELSATEVTEAYLARIQALDPDLHAFVTVAADRARERARQQTAAGPADSLPLFGLPIAHKDLFETAGIRTTGGSRLYEHHVPSRDATLVARLSWAGATTLGKTNTHELGGGVTTINPFFGTTRNPHDRRRISGGSSGGSAAAVAARLALAATGSDTGGSVRIPAAFCGCVGFKPTFGLLSTAGVLGASPTFDHAGFLTRGVSDLVPLMRSAMGLDPDDPSTVPAIPLDVTRDRSLMRVRIGTPRAYFFDDMDADVGRAIEATLGRLSKAGAVIRDVHVPVDPATMARVFDPIVVAEIHQTYARDWRERPELFSEAFAGFFKTPLPAPLELATAYRERRGFQADMARVFEEVDLLAMPTVPVVAPLITGPIDGNRILRNTWPFNAARTPALSLPCGPTDRLPVGLQLVARPFDDARLLNIAAHLETRLR